MTQFFKSLCFIGLAVFTLVALSGCASTPATSNDEPLEPNAVFSNVNLTGKWQADVTFPPATEGESGLTRTYDFFLIDSASGKFIGTAVDLSNFSTNAIAGERSGRNVVLFLSGAKLLGQILSRTSIAGTVHTQSPSTGTWSMTRIR